jgi:2-keto-4-pentenoate hydratase
VWAGGLKAGQFVTCGSWTGKTLVGPAATARVRFPSLGEVRVRYTV